MELGEEGFSTDVPDCQWCHKPMKPVGSGVSDKDGYDRWWCDGCTEELKRNF